jgi:hypothetical protein
MGYSKEIVVYVDPESEKINVLTLLETMVNGNWELSFNDKLSILDVGSEFRWITLHNTEADRTRFTNILNTKAEMQEFIAFQLYSPKIKKFIWINLDPTKSEFIFDIEKDLSKKPEEEFNDFHELIIPIIVNQFSGIDRVEWRTDYDSRIIRTYKY